MSAPILFKSFEPVDIQSGRTQQTVDSLTDESNRFAWGIFKANGLKAKSLEELAGVLGSINHDRTFVLVKILQENYVLLIQRLPDERLKEKKGDRLAQSYCSSARCGQSLFNFDDWRICLTPSGNFLASHTNNSKKLSADFHPVTSIVEALKNQGGPQSLQASNSEGEYWFCLACFESWFEIPNADRSGSEICQELLWAVVPYTLLDNRPIKKVPAHRALGKHNKLAFEAWRALRFYEIWAKAPSTAAGVYGPDCSVVEEMSHFGTIGSALFPNTRFSTAIEKHLKGRKLDEFIDLDLPSFLSTFVTLQHQKGDIEEISSVQDDEAPTTSKGKRKASNELNKESQAETSKFWGGLIGTRIHRTNAFDTGDDPDLRTILNPRKPSNALPHYDQAIKPLSTNEVLLEASRFLAPRESLSDLRTKIGASKRGFHSRLSFLQVKSDQIERQTQKLSSRKRTANVMAELRGLNEEEAENRDERMRIEAEIEALDAQELALTAEERRMKTLETQLWVGALHGVDAQRQDAERNAQGQKTAADQARKEAEELRQNLQDVRTEMDGVRRSQSTSK